MMEKKTQKNILMSYTSNKMGESYVEILKLSLLPNLDINLDVLLNRTISEPLALIAC